MTIQISSVRDTNAAIRKRACKSTNAHNGYLYSSCLCVRALPNEAHHFPARNTMNINGKQPLTSCPIIIMSDIVSTMAKENWLGTLWTREFVGGSYKICCSPKTTGAAYRIDRLASTREYEYYFWVRTPMFADCLPQSRACHHAIERHGRREHQLVGTRQEANTSGHTAITRDAWGEGDRLPILTWFIPWRTHLRRK